MDLFARAIDAAFHMVVDSANNVSTVDACNYCTAKSFHRMSAD
jgi:hypothetical protein